MCVVDMDAHAPEIEKTGDYMGSPVQRYRPVLVSETVKTGGLPNFWAIDEKVFSAPYPSSARQTD